MCDPFTILVNDYRPMILAYLRSQLQDEHLAEDLTQETFLAAQKTLDQFEEGGHFGKWLRGIARNKALMHWRSARRKPLLIDSRVVEGIEEVFNELDDEQAGGEYWDQRKRALRECIAGLSRQLRGAVELVYYKEQSLDEAALVLASNRAAIGQRLSRARKAIFVCVNEKLKSEESR